MDEGRGKDTIENKARLGSAAGPSACTKRADVMRIPTLPILGRGGSLPLADATGDTGECKGFIVTKFINEFYVLGSL